jgi:hypothetical protein
VLISVGMMMAALASCGDQSQQSAEELTVAQDVEGQADWTYQQIWGDAEQKDGGQFLANTAIQRPIKECMSGRGLTYPAKFTPLWLGYQSNGTSGAWMGHLQEAPSKTEVLLTEAHQLERSPQVNPDLNKPGYREALAECEKLSGDPDKVVVPEGTEELGAEFTRLKGAVEDELGSLEPYTKCMAEAGFDLGGMDAEGWTALYMLLTSKMPDPPLSGQEPTEEWTRYLKMEAEALDADETCRAEKYREGLTVLGPRLRVFRQEHAEQLAASERAWADLLKRAEAQGYRG